MSAAMFNIVIIVVIVVLLIMHKKTWLKSTPTDEDLLKPIEDGFVKEVVASLPTSTPTTSTPSTSTPSTAKVFNKGDTNWKFSDGSSGNLSCWRNWTYKDSTQLTRENISGSVSTSYLLPSEEVDKDGRFWCPVDNATRPLERAQYVDHKPTSTAGIVKNLITKNAGSIIGLAGAIGLGLTEEIIMKSIEKSAKQAFTKASREVGEDLAAKMTRKLYKETAEEINEKLARKVGSKLTKEIEEKAVVKGERSATKMLRQKVTKELEEKVGQSVDDVAKRVFGRSVRKVQSQVAGKAGSKFVFKFNQEVADKAGKELAEAIARKPSVVASKLFVAKGVKTVQNVAARQVTKKLSSLAQSKVLQRVASKFQKELGTMITKTISKSLDNVAKSIASKMAKQYVRSALSVIKPTVLAKAIFRSEAKMFLSFGKLAAKSSDDLAKVALKLTKLGQSLGRVAARAGFKTGVKLASRIARSLKPGPLAIFDMVSMALDMADVGGYNSFLTTDDYNKKIAELEQERKKTMMEELKKGDVYKDVNIQDIEYPIVLDPITAADTSVTDGLLKDKIDLLFELAFIMEPHPCIKKYLDEMNKDLASGALTPEGMSDDAKMAKYNDLLDLDSLAELMVVDNCDKANGVLFVDENGNNRCTYNKTDCAAQFSWPLKADDSDTYTQWIDGKCVLANPEVRRACEQLKASWDTNTNSCVLDRGWCRSVGGSFTNGKCTIPLTQEIAEFIFGTTVTRFFKTMGGIVVNPIADIVGAYINPPSTTVYTGFIRQQIPASTPFNMCVELDNGDTNVPRRVGLSLCNDANQQLFKNNVTQKFTYNNDSGFIFSQTDLVNGQKLCLERPYGIGNKLWANYCNGSQEQKWTYDPTTQYITPRDKPNDRLVVSTASGTDYGIEVGTNPPYAVSKFAFDSMKINTATRSESVNSTVTSMGNAVLDLVDPFGIFRLAFGSTSSTDLSRFNIDKYGTDAKQYAASVDATFNTCGS